jgi:uncharacterized protein (DUF1800 family)
MGDQNTVLSEADARHLLRRTGFGALRSEVADIVALSPSDKTRGAVVDGLLDFKPKAFKPGGKDLGSSHNKWVKFMTKGKLQLEEKLVLFWHDHFATAFSKVQDAKLMASEIQLLHKNCKGNFKSFVKQMNKNAAMMEYLDTVRNVSDVNDLSIVPNENYGRELQELFTLGVLDSAGNPNYAQTDVVQIARAFTGWDYDRSGKAFLRDYAHDHEANFPSRGVKEIYGTHGNFAGAQNFGSLSAGGEGEAEIDTVIDIIFQHRDTNLKNTVARRTARRLIEYFAHPDPTLSFIDDVVLASHFDLNFEISGLLRAIFVHDDFYLTGAPVPWGVAAAASVKWPIDYVVSTLRLFGMKLKGGDQFVDGDSTTGGFTTALEHLTSMGQILLDPPSVFGWDWEANWLSSATLLARYNFAVELTSSRGGGKSAFRPDKFGFALSLSSPTLIVDEAAEILGVKDHLTTGEHDALVDYLTDGGLNLSLDLNDYDTRNIKLHGLFALLLQSPAYQLH